MPRSKLLALFGVVALLTGLAFAAAKPFQHEARGTVVSTDSSNDTIVVRLDDGTTKTFKYESTLDVLNIGRDDYVMVQFNDQPNGDLLAVRIDETTRAAGTTTTPSYDSTASAYDRNTPDTTSTASGTARYDDSTNTGPTTTPTYDNDSMNMHHDNLPATASHLPLLAVLGIGSLLGALALRFIRS